MKISRREHLKKLGLGAAGTLGAGLFANDHIATLAAMRGLPARDWPWTSAKPSVDNPGIRMIFAGLMLFTYKRTGNDREGRVIFHRGSEHKLQIIVDRGSPGSCTKLTTIDVSDDKRIEFVIPQRNYHHVTYFQTGDQDDFDRTTWHDKDFRWLLDVEGPETFNNKDFNRTDNHGFDTRLHVQAGRFYTYQRTNSTFKADVGTLKGQVFKIAKVMACDLRLEDGEKALLKIDHKPIEVGGRPLEMENPAKYEIYFLNVPSCDPCVTSEFPMVFHAIEDGEDFKFDLTLVDKGKNDEAPNLCEKVGGTDRFSDEAPCSGAGFGGGRGFP